MAEDQGALALVLDLAKAFERVSLPVVWAWATRFPRKILRVLCGVFRTPEASSVRRMCGRANTDHHGHLAGVQVCLHQRIVLQDALSEVTKKLPSIEVVGFLRDDITALLMEKNKEVAGMTKNAMKKLKKEVERKGLKMSVTEDGKEGMKEQDDCVVWLFWRLSCVNSAKKKE